MMIKDILEAVRDFVWGLLPKSLAPKVKANQYAFLCHPLDAGDAARKYPFAKNISENLFKLWTRNFWPVLGAEILGAHQKNGGQSRGWAVIQPVPPALMIQDPEFGRKKIMRGVKFCEKLGFKLVALGGYNSILTHDGADLVGKTNIAVTTGNTYSALLVIQNLEKIAAKLQLNLMHTKIAIIGAAGSVGSACARIIPARASEVWLMDLNVKTLNELYSELNKNHSNIKLFKDLGAVRSMDVVITATSTPRAIITEDQIEPGMIFIDAAQPKNISSDIAKDRKDVLVIDSGIARVPFMKCAMTMGPSDNEVYACLGEAMILAWHDRISSYSIGKVRVDHVNELALLASDAGFSVADFRNASGYISDGDLRKFKENYFPRQRIQDLNKKPKCS